MALPDILKNRLAFPSLPLRCSSSRIPLLVTAQCKAGIVGSFPASYNARPQSALDEWLPQIEGRRLAAHDAAHPDRPAAPFASTRSCTSRTTASSRTSPTA